MAHAPLAVSPAAPLVASAGIIRNIDEARSRFETLGPSTQPSLDQSISTVDPPISMIAGPMSTGALSLHVLILSKTWSSTEVVQRTSVTFCASCIA